MTSFYTSVERFGSTILHRGYENGRRFSRKVDFQPTLFIPTKDADAEYRTLLGKHPVKEKQFDTMSEAKDFVEKYKDVSGFQIYGNTNFVHQFIQKVYPTDIQFDMSHINIFNFDIEVDISEKLPDMETADNEITSIAIKSSKSETYHLLGRKDFDKTKTLTGINPENIQFMKFDSERDLLRRFIQIWTNDFPDIVTGWNVEYFDIYYIVTRIIRVLGEGRAKELSPWGRIKKNTTEIFNRPQSTYKISGVTVIDYMDAFKKFGYKYGTQESYKLDHIAHVVLGMNKLDYSEYGSLTELYNQNPQLYLDYNLRDTQIIQLFEEETALLSLVLTVAYGGGVNYGEAFATVGIWESTLYRKLMTKKLVPDVKSGPGDTLGELVGGYVKDPDVGLKEWIVSFDLNSLYPHLMLQYNMSPETFMPDEREYVTQELVLDGEYQNSKSDRSVCANGVCFTNQKLGIIPEIIDEYYENRKKIKTEMLRYEQLEQDEKDPELKKEYKKQITQLHNAQMAIKIAMNSLYGAAANKYFLYYIPEMAEAITTSGQLSIRYAQKSVNKYLNKVLETDNIDYVAYCVDGSTKLQINDKEETISDLYDRINVSHLDGVKLIQDRNIFVMSYNTETKKREYKRATAVIKKKATKKMYKVWIDERKYVIVSGDHRFIIERNGEITEATALELLENDKFINIHGYTQKGEYRCMKSATIRETSV